MRDPSLEGFLFWNNLTIGKIWNRMVKKKGDFMDILGLIGFGSILIVLLVFILAIVSYFLSSIAIMTLGRKAGIDAVWLAWIPVGNLYIIGKLIKTIEFGEKSYEQAEYILPGAFLLSTILGRIDLLGKVPSLLMWLLSLYSLFMLFKMYVPKDVTKYMILSIFLPGLGAGISLFSIKDRQPILEG